MPPKKTNKNKNKTRNDDDTPINTETLLNIAGWQ